MYIVLGCGLTILTNVSHDSRARGGVSQDLLHDEISSDTDRERGWGGKGGWTESVYICPTDVDRCRQTERRVGGVKLLMEEENRL